MKNWFSQFFDQINSQERNVLRVIVIVIIASLASSPIYIYAAAQTGAWQMYAILAGLVLICAIAVFCASLTRRKQINLAIGLILGSVYFIIGLIIALISGLGLVLSVTLLLVGIITVGQTLSGKAATRAVLVSVAFAVITLIMDLFAPWDRLSVPQLQAAIPYISGGVIAILGFFLLRQYGNFSLRTKLLGAFLLVTLVPLVIVFIINNRTNTRDLTNNSDAALGAIAAQTASALDTFLAERLNDVRVEAQHHILAEYLALPPSERAGSESETALYSDLLAITRRDQTFINSVGLIDKNGVSVADTEPTEVGVDKSDRNYFIQARDTQLPYVSPVEISGTTGKISMYLTAPVRNQDGQFVGVLRIRYDAAVIQSIIKKSADQANLGGLSIVVLDENHIRLAHNLAPELILKSVVPLPSDKVAQLQAERRLPSDKPVEELSTNLQDLEDGLNNLDNQQTFVAEFHDVGEGNEEGTAVHLENQPWFVAVGQDQDVFLAPLTSQARTNIILALIVAIAVAVAGVLVARTISNPVLRLTSVAQQIAGGDINVQAKVESSDEIGQLAGTFNQMTAQLRDFIASLEQRVQERTKALSSVAEVSTVASTILETDKLLQQVVDLAKERFDFYHAHIYLLNDQGDTLVLAAGAGEPGRQMVAEKRAIPLAREQSLVARAARERKGVTVNDVTTEPDFLSNPLLPDTHSELAVPMIVGEQVIGVFDVQSEIVGRFTDADIAVQTTLASQVASAVQNARLYTQAETIAQEAQSLVDNAPEAIIIIDLETGMFTNPNENAIRLYGLARNDLVKVGPAQMSPPNQPDGQDSTKKAMEKIGEAMQGNTPIFEWMHRNGQGEDFLCEIRLVRLPGAHPRVRASVTDISERKRSEELIRQRAQQQESLNLITQRIQSATTIESALQVTARELGRALGMKPTLVTIESDSTNGENKSDS